MGCPHCYRIDCYYNKYNFELNLERYTSNYEAQTSEKVQWNELERILKEVMQSKLPVELINNVAKYMSIELPNSTAKQVFKCYLSLQQRYIDHYDVMSQWAFEEDCDDDDVMSQWAFDSDSD